MVLLAYIFVCSLSLLEIANCYTYEVNYTSLDTLYYDSVDRDGTHAFIFTSQPGTLRLTAELLDTPDNTPLFVSIQYLDVFQSASLPTLYQSYSQAEYMNRTTRVLCVDTAGAPIRVLFESNSLTPVSYSFSLSRVISNRLHLDTLSSTLVSPSEPTFFTYTIDTDYFDIILKSENILCSVISIKEGACPFAMRLQVMDSRAYTMTMRTDASLTLRRGDFLSDNILVTMTGAPGESCDITSEFSSNQSAENYSKNISVLVTSSSPPSQYWRGVLLSIFIFFIPYLLFGCYIFINLILRSSRQRYKYLFFTIGLPPLPLEYLAPSTESENNLDIPEELYLPKQNDLLEPRIIAKYRAKLDAHLLIDYSLKLPSQQTKSSTHLRNKFNSYFYFILVLFIFYGIPAVQIAFDQLDQLASSRNQDLCYYNFRCERRVNSIRAFNNLLSNGAYVTYGMLFLILVGIRHVSYNIQSSKHPETNAHGVPYFFGVFYAMGVALMAEGVMSTLYHTCPTRANYQFDISFMFVMLTLIMVRLFQQRHPDGNVKAVSTFLIISCAIGLSSIGLWHGETYFYLIRIIYLLLLILFSGALVISVYYFGMPNICLVPLYEIFVVRKPINEIDTKRLLLAFKHDRARFFQIGCFLLANILVISLMFSATTIPDFPSVILYTFIFNFALYFLYYWIMKFVKKEFKYRPHVFTASFVLFIFSVICWMFALAFYFNKVKQWRESASASRVRNEECVLLDFYDNHDIWHFLSALALFSMYVSIFVIDDNIVFVKRENIDIF